MTAPRLPASAGSRFGDVDQRGCPLTVTVCSTAPTSNAIGTFSVWLVCSVTVASARLKPVPPAVILYYFRSRLRNRKLPDASEVVVAETCVVTLTKSTFAFATAAPLGSSTTPSMLPVYCA